MGSASRHVPGSSASGERPVRVRGRERDVDCRADGMREVARECRGHVGRPIETRQVEPGEIELHRLRLDEPRRIGGHGERRDRDLRLAVPVRASSARRPSTGRRPRRAARPRIREATRCVARSIGEQEPGIVTLRVFRRASERRVAQVAPTLTALPSALRASGRFALGSAPSRSCHAVDPGAEERELFLDPSRSPGRGDRCDRSSSRLRPSGRR